MNDTLAPVRSPVADRLTLPVADAAHLTVLDRTELRLGLWLLLRSARRQHSARDHHDHARRLANARLSDERDRVALRSHALQCVRT